MKFIKKFNNIDLVDENDIIDIFSDFEDFKIRVFFTKKLYQTKKITTDINQDIELYYVPFIEVVMYPIIDLELDKFINSDMFTNTINDIKYRLKHFNLEIRGYTTTEKRITILLYNK